MNEEEFWHSFDAGPNGCLVWARGTTSAGYGCVRLNGKMWLAHRLAHTLVDGPIPRGKDIHHSCKNKLCGRPEHLVVLGHEIHMSMSAAKLTPAQVSEIRHSTEPGVIIAKRFNVSPGEIYLIQKHKRFKYIDYLRKEVLAA